MMRKDYTILLANSTWDYAKTYFDQWKQSNGDQAATNTANLPGLFFRNRLEGSGVLTKNVQDDESYYNDMMFHLINTKRPRIFAESEITGIGSVDWTGKELYILGDTAIAAPVTIFDNGRHNAGPEDIHDPPIEGTLYYVPGALLRNGRGHVPCDMELVATQDDSGLWHLDVNSLYALYERRLLPSLLHANRICGEKSKKGFVTIPGIGCGQFSGPFYGQMGKYLGAVIQRILENHSDKLPNIKVVYYDPYNECRNQRQNIGHISYMVRPLRKTPRGSRNTPQLCHPRDFAEDGDDFDDCYLCSFVAWDHVSWPGNDYWVGSRATDDGVKAAATSTMGVMTGIAGAYDSANCVYAPPAGFLSWESVVRQYRLEIEVKKGQNFVIEEW